LRTTQQLTAGETLWLLLENFLQERDCVTDVAQLDRTYRLQPQTALRFAEFLFRFNRHPDKYNFIAVPRHHKWFHLNHSTLGVGRLILSRIPVGTRDEDSLQFLSPRASGATWRRPIYLVAQRICSRAPEHVRTRHSSTTRCRSN